MEHRLVTSALALVSGDELTEPAGEQLSVAKGNRSQDGTLEIGITAPAF
jgi:hypothetical protein